MLDESSLYGVRVLAIGQALDRGDCLALPTGGQRQTGDDAAPVEMALAGAIGAVVTAFLVVQVGVFAQGVEQKGPRVSDKLQ